VTALQVEQEDFGMDDSDLEAEPRWGYRPLDTIGWI
jgi:hypothetical protein